VSVIVATYRRPDGLAACLRGLRAQSRAADEVIVVVHSSDDASARYVGELACSWPQLRSESVDAHGSVAAYNQGLASAEGMIVAYIDDDAVPSVDWLERIAETFARDERIAAVGGRDVIVENGRILGSPADRGRRAPSPTVGRVQWSGRMLGNHHIGTGPARDVDVLKGTNMSLRRAAVAGHGFDERLRGDGAQVHSELSVCLPLRRRGLRVVYDPAIVVEHFPAPRPRGDHRHSAQPEAVFPYTHNETLAILEYFGPARRVVYALWGLAIGTTYSPGAAVLVRDVITRRPGAGRRFVAAQRGRAVAWKTRRSPRRVPPARRQLRILRIADVPDVATAGMSGYIRSSAEEIERRGHRVTFWSRGQLAPRITHPGTRRLLVPWLIAAKVIASTRLRKRYDIVEINAAASAPYSVLARLAGRRLAPCVVLSFGLDERLWQAELEHLRHYGRRPPLRSRILVPSTLLSQARLGLRTAEAVLIPSTQDRDHLIRRLGVPPERVSFGFTGVSEDLFDVERKAGIDARVLFLGSWIERKGTIELVAAWRRLAKDRPGVRLTVAGVGDAEAAGADLRGLPGVELVPSVRRDELPGLLSAHDMFVLPSWYEGMPLAMLEAAAAGLACVVCAVCGNLDVFAPEDPQRDGAILIPPNDERALYRALLLLVDDAELRLALGARARERARQFTWAHNAEQTLGAYSAAIKRRGRVTAGV
jgi:glycosyltransferase involved in cell wall biosynthesis/GT2 family glycosyltransferase